MKKILPIALTVLIGLAACKSGTKNDLDSKKEIVLSDTTKVYPNNSASDTAVITKTTPVVAAPLANSPVSKAPTKAVVKNTKPSQAPAPTATTTTTTTPVTTTTGTTTTTTATTPATTTGTTTTTAPVAPEKKKGWSNSAKGAVIGGVGGAAAGAVIGKNGKGAIIGGIIGAAGGYIIGKKKDKKDSTNH
ncbi:MAG: YMGG-like glycine zipper-containing protein [Ferruginibacter sp.]